MSVLFGAPHGPEVPSLKVCQLCQTPVAWKVVKGAWDKKQVPLTECLVAVLDSSYNPTEAGTCLSNPGSCMLI